MAYVRQAIRADVAHLSSKIRKADRDEIKASDNVRPSEALLAPFNYKGAITFSVIGTNKEHVIAMFGSVPSPEKEYGVAWLDVRNTKTLKWLKYLGFKQIETIENYGYAKKPFMLITKEMT